MGIGARSQNRDLMATYSTGNRDAGPRRRTRTASARRRRRLSVEMTVRAAVGLYSIGARSPECDIMSAHCSLSATVPRRDPLMTGSCTVLTPWSALEETAAHTWAGAALSRRSVHK